MERLPDTIEPDDGANETMIRAALEYLRLGYRPIPLVSATKRAAIKWKRYQSQAPTEKDIRRWFSSGRPGIALLTGGGIAVVDVDDAGLVDAIGARCGDTPMRCRTPGGGFHLYYRTRRGVHYGNAVRINGEPVDLRCEGAYAACPWTCGPGGVSYEWIGPVLPPRELPILQAAWLRSREPPAPLAPVEVTGDEAATMRRVRSYVAHVEGAISGQRGHDRTMRVAGVLMQKFGLSIGQALPIFREWNEQCEPPWSEKELLHKLQDAHRLRHQYPRGGQR